MLRFEIGQRESGFYSERIESQTDATSRTVIVYRCGEPIVLRAQHLKFGNVSRDPSFSFE